MSLIDKIKKGVAVATSTVILGTGIAGFSVFLDYRNYMLHVIGLNEGLGEKYEVNFHGYTKFYFKNLEPHKGWLDQAEAYICQKGEKQFCREDR